MHPRRSVYLALLAAHSAAAEPTNAIASEDAKAEHVGQATKRFNGFFFTVFQFAVGTRRPALAAGFGPVR